MTEFKILSALFVVLSVAAWGACHVVPSCNHQVFLDSPTSLRGAAVTLEVSICGISEKIHSNRVACISETTSSAVGI